MPADRAKEEAHAGTIHDYLSLQYGHDFSRLALNPHVTVALGRGKHTENCERSQLAVKKVFNVAKKGATATEATLLLPSTLPYVASGGPHQGECEGLDEDAGSARGEKDTQPI